MTNVQYKEGQGDFDHIANFFANFSESQHIKKYIYEID